MAIKLSIKVGSCIHVISTDNLLFEVVDSHKGHYKVLCSKIPSRRGKRPKTTQKTMFWTTSEKFKKEMKKLKGINLSSTVLKTYLKEGL
jgi:hypothetical protein